MVISLSCRGYGRPVAQAVRKSFGAVFLLAMAGCSGKFSPPTPVVYVPLFDVSSSQRNDLIAHFFSPGDASSGSSKGYIDRAANVFAIGDISGQLNSNRDTVLLDDGGMISIRKGSTKYVANYSIQRPGSNPAFGILGIPSQAINIPRSGTMRYSGRADLQVIDGTAVYDLIGTISVVGDFSSSTLDATIGNLDGVRLDGGGTASTASDVLSISVAGAAILGTSFSGGKVRIEKSSLSRGLSGNELSKFFGSFFGPQLGESGGVIVIDDSAAGSALTIQGSFVSN